MKNQLRAVIYCRVSSQGQEEGTSLSAQLSACYQEAEKHNAIVVNIQSEIVSGALYKARPDMQEALSLIEAGEADVLIVPKLDRAGRDVEALRDIRRRIERAGGQLIFADGLNFDKSAVGNLMFTQLAGFAEFERELIKERTSRGRIQRARQGIMPTRAMKPFGYTIIRNTDVAAGTHTKEQIGTYEIVPSQEPFARAIFERYAAGSSLREIARWLHASGVAPVRGGSAWFAQTLRTILKNPVYYGRPAFRKNGSMTDESRVERGLSHRAVFARDESEWIYMNAPAIVSEELWRACQTRLHSAQQTDSGRPDRRHLLTGLLRCPSCGRSMRFRTRLGRMYIPREGTKEHAKQLRGRGVKARGRRGKPHRAYQCPYGGNSIAPGVAKCHTLFCNAERFEALAVRGVLEVASRPEVLQKAREHFSRRPLPNADQRERLTKEIKKVEVREAQAVEREIAALSEGRDATPYSALVARLSRERAELQRKLQEWEVTDQAQTAAGSLHPVIADFKDELEKVLLAPAEDVPDYRKNELLRRVVTRIDSDSDRKGILLHLAGLTSTHEFVCYVREGEEVRVELKPVEAKPV